MQSFACVTLMTIAHSATASESSFECVFTENEYNEAENIFTFNSDHGDHLVEFLEEKVLPKITSKESFLDIGAGPGIITGRIAHYFPSTTIIEPDESYAPTYLNAGYKTHFANFQDISIHDQFDLVVCSHVLYHLSRNHWDSYLRKMYDSIRIKGKGLVALIAPRGDWHGLRVSINPNHATSRDVEYVLKEQKTTYEIFPIVSSFQVSRYLDFKRLLRLFTIDDCFTEEEFKALSEEEKNVIDDKIEAFIAQCKQQDGSYILICEDDYFILNKD